MKVFAVTLAGCALAVASAGVAAAPAAPTPAPTPFVIGTLQPFGTEPQLPTIGGTRAVRPACAVMRSAIIPSFQAAQKADVRFVETRKRVPQYVDVALDPSHQDDAYGAMMLHRLDQDVSEMLVQSQQIAKALSDPAFEQHKNDPEVLAEQKALQRLYEAQKIRANLLSDFVIREQVALAKRDEADNGAFRSRQAPMYGVSAPPMPLPQLTPAPGMGFMRSGIPLADKARATEWLSTVASFVHEYENQSAKTFYTIAKNCSK